MRHAGVCLIVFLCLLLSASTPRHFRRVPAPSPDIEKLLTKARKLAAAADYDGAVILYQSELNRQSSSNNRIPLLIGAGSCRLAKQQYSEALRLLAEADALAKSAGYAQHRVTVASNRASLYRRIGDLDGALAAMRVVDTPVSGVRNPAYLLQMASLMRDIDLPPDGSREREFRARRDVDFQQSVPLFHSAIRLASEMGDVTLEALAWQYLGVGYLRRSDLKHGDAAQSDLNLAEEALTQTFRLRVISGRRQFQSACFFLGQVRRRQGRRTEATNLLRLANELAQRADAYVPAPWTFHELGLVAVDAGDLNDALRNFEKSIESTGDIRLRLPSAESFRLTGEAGLQQLYSDYVRTGMQYFRQTGRQEIARRMLRASEASRALIFEATLSGSRNLPPEYWDLLRRYQRVLARSVRDESENSDSEISALRSQLAELESRFSVRREQRKNSHQKNEKSSSGSALEDLQRKLKGTETVLSFHAGTDESYLWALTNRSLEAHILPGSRTLSALIAEFCAQLRAHDPRSRQTGEKIRRMLLDGLSASVASKPDWILSLDGPFFELPFAALPLPSGSKVPYLGLQHSLRTVPGIFIAQRGDAPPASEKAFAAFADARYNAADPRWGDDRPKALGQEQLARLPATALEADACARAWGRDLRPEVMRGAQVSRAAVLDAISRKPAVLHLAGHVLPHPRSPDQVLVALGLQRDGIADYLGPSDITALDSSVGLVTLSGCGSATGKALPGLGLFGLTRAWLVSGASAVVATHWPMPDGSGEILTEMYAVLRDYPGPVTASGVAKALHTARIRMMQARDGRSDPGYWGAFMVAGKD